MAEIYTIEEAKQKMCCAMMQPCAADNCMAWKFSSFTKDITPLGVRPMTPKFEVTVDKSKGSCGLVK